MKPSTCLTTHYNRGVRKYPALTSWNKTAQPCSTCIRWRQSCTFTPNMYRHQETDRTTFNAGSKPLVITYWYQIPLS